MHAPRNPGQAYRRVEFDARVAGASPRELVLVCYDQLGEALGRAVSADQRGDNQGKSTALTRAMTAIAALQLGIDQGAPLSAALGQFYAGARQTLLGAVLNFDAGALMRLRGDVAEIRHALAESN